MQLLKDKFVEVLSSVMPIVVLVVILALTIVDVPGDVMARFGIGSVLLILGLTIFLFGVDVGMEPIGDYLGHSIIRASSHFAVMLLTFLIGFSITVAEPDLLILGQQISDATGGLIGAQLIVLVVSIGVGIMIALGVYRIMKDVALKWFFLIVYGLIFILTFFADSTFLAMAFDASGATTGALTTPFVLALGASVSSRKGGKGAEDDAFGLVGAMSTGPIIAVLLMAIIQQSEIQDFSHEYQYAKGIVAPFVLNIQHTFQESLFALIPILIVFGLVYFVQKRLSQMELVRIMVGIIYVLIGLTLFLVGVNQGFMDMGRYLATELATNYQSLLPWIGLVMGLVVVLAEPAVHVLGDQVEEVTGGHIPNKLLLFALSIGVGLAVALSMVRIMIPSVELWHFLLPGFGLSILLSFFVPNLFTGIAFDAGGVASGPMTATFILAFAQGVAATLPQADVLVDGFGIIATVAMAPVLMIQLIGLFYKLRVKNNPAIDE
ncbi:DUF1538 domain-containing protein [Aerococcus sp. 1KP-2016]|uniref:DUF1538 domain-containing protein n=1 Tax=Aerococcus sp. 1KP-2016 TaxID=1981982 RepID=UPI000B991ECE|nr:DUF1538 domain-containing protein [Aerococcus sp. 1KP-2016]OYQ68183.1 hypothetical protein B9P78_00945 [Aerococcus sp. 1KP-2016]